MSKTSTLRNSSIFIQLRKWLITMFLILAAIFFIHYASNNIDNIPVLRWNVASSLIAFFSVILVVFGISIAGIIWQILLYDYGFLISFKHAQIIFSISQFGKYLPGNVGQHLGRVLIAHASGIPASITLSTMLIEMLWGVAISAGLALISFIFLIENQMVINYLKVTPLQISLIAILLFFMPWLGIKFLNTYLTKLVKKFFGCDTIAAPKLYTVLIVGILFLLCFFLMGLILKLQAQWFFGVAQGNVLELTCLFSIAWLAGYLVPGLPGGLGVRETIMVFLLSPVLGSGTAVGLSITLRVTTTIGDAVAFLLGSLLRFFTSCEFRCGQN